MKEFKTVKVKITEKQEHFNDTEVNQGISKRPAGTIHEFKLTKAIQKGIDLGWFEVIEEEKLPGADDLNKFFADMNSQSEKIDETGKPNEIESVKTDPSKVTQAPKVETQKNQPTKNKGNKGNKK